MKQQFGDRCMSVANSQHVRLLVVDDVAENRDLLGRFFRRRGFEVIEAENGVAALALIEQQHFDAVLLDVVMPEMNGLEALERIRAIHSLSSLPVIMVTAKVESRDIVQALELGANDYITKPIDFAVTFARVQSQLARQQAERALAHHVEKLESTNRRLEYEIAERKQSEARISYMAQHDALTGLSNRGQFREHLIRTLGRIRETGHKLALLFMDLDQFKLINDTLGHGTGDLLLAAIGDRLKLFMDDCDTIARLGGDEFAVICIMEQGVEAAGALAESIMKAISEPYDIDGHQLVLSCSIGIACAPDHGNNPDLLLSNADLALYRAKAEGRCTFRFFELEMNAHAQARRLLECELRKALHHGEFALHYQPLFNLTSGRITGFEALLRWKHCQRGVMLPPEFISVAEDTGLIIPLSQWVLREACREATRWPQNIKLAVNLSPVQFRGRTLEQDVVHALASSGLSPDRLELEITETVLLEDSKKTMQALHQLRSMGVRVSMDDFGTGYSSLSYLRMFPFDKIKIDRCFVRDLPKMNDSTAIVRAIVTLANSLGMLTTAEGVETEEQMAYLKEEGCTEVQGYLISRPLPAEDVGPMLEDARAAELKVA
jgi:diguanylate cyclase (GGDEF)-like protein